jgi:hypothetical protein
MHDCVFRTGLMLGALAAMSSLHAATGDHWLLAEWPQGNGTFIYDYIEGSGIATNPRALSIGGSPASLMVSGLDFDNQGRLFAITSSGLYEVNTGNGALTLRGAFGIGIEGAAAYDPVQDRFLIAAGTGGIEEVNLTTFARTPLSPLNGLDDVSGVAVTPDGRIWILDTQANGNNVGHLYELQGSTPVSYGSLSLSLVGAISGFDADSNGNLTFTSHNSVYRVHPIFGAPSVTLIDTFSGAQSAQSSLALQAVPEPSIFVTGILAMGIAGRIRRRRWYASSQGQNGSGTKR